MRLLYVGMMVLRQESSGMLSLPEIMCVLRSPSLHSLVLVQHVWLCHSVDRSRVEVVSGVYV